mgnify:CR=1 FL=1
MKFNIKYRNVRVPGKVVTMGNSTLNCIAHTLIIIGAINWGLIGFLRFDLVRVLFGDMSILSRIIYAAVGISGLYAISYFGRIRSAGEY